MAWSVRRAVPGDEERLRTVRLAALADSPSAFRSTSEREVERTPEDWRRWIDDGATFFAVGEDGGEPVGLVAVFADRDDPAVLRLVSMWLHPSVRGSGAADGLMGAALAWAGVRPVRLCVIRGNAAARRLYERHGFRFTGECGDELTMDRAP